MVSDVMALLSTMLWNIPSKDWSGGAGIADASLNHQRQTIRVGAGVAFAQVGTVGFGGQIGLEAQRLFEMPEAALVVLYASPGCRSGRAAWRWRPP